MLTEEQKGQLAQPLDQRLVKKNFDGYDYIEGYVAKRHANEIFGYDGWIYTLDRVQEVYAGDHKDKHGNDLRMVCYTAQVSVDVGNVIRQDVGFGSGYGKTDGDATEGAIKEAVTDGLKRALVSFGDQFGLDLYAKKEDRGKGQQQSQPQPQQQEPTFREWFDGQIKFYTEALGKDGMDAVLKQQGIGDLAAIKTRGEATKLIKALASAVDKQAASQEHDIPHQPHSKDSTYSDHVN